MTYVEQATLRRHAPPVSASRRDRPNRSRSEKSQRILCIEDDRETAGLLGEALGDLGYLVEIAHSGAEGMRAIDARRPDLVLCDLNMPGMSGFDVLERVAALPHGLHHMPFLFLTALTDRESELRGRRLGADDYVGKPIDFEVLDAIIKTRLTRSGREERKHAQIELSERETDALTWSARGKTSDEIAQILGLTKRTVDFHIDNARAKLGVATRIEAVAMAVAADLIEV
ncbi:MAG TPA: response regulator [Caulobacteraceae bacterium]|nr:response regulator [Caulobacteraceae bacterium]